MRARRDAGGGAARWSAAMAAPAVGADAGPMRARRVRATPSARRSSRTRPSARPRPPSREPTRSWRRRGPSRCPSVSVERQRRPRSTRRAGSPAASRSRRISSRSRGNVQYLVGGFAALGQARDQAAVATASSVQARQGVAVAAAQAYLAVIAAPPPGRCGHTIGRHRAGAPRLRARRLEGGVGSRLNQLRAAQAVTADQPAARAGATGASAGAGGAGRRARQRRAGRCGRRAGVRRAGDDRRRRLDARAARPPYAQRPSGRRPSASCATAGSTGRRCRRWRSRRRSITPSGLFQPSRTWRFTFSVTQPLFDGGQRRADEARARRPRSTSRRWRSRGCRSRRGRRCGSRRRPSRSLERALATARTAVDQATEVLRITHGRLRGRRDDEHRGHRRPAVAPRRRDRRGVQRGRRAPRETRPARGDRRTFRSSVSRLRRPGPRGQACRGPATARQSRRACVAA